MKREGEMEAQGESSKEIRIMRMGGIEVKK